MTSASTDAICAVGSDQLSYGGPSTGQLGKVHIATFVDRRIAALAVGSEPVAKIGQPCLSAIPLDQERDALASVAVAFGAANFKKMKIAKVAEGTRAF